MMTFEETGRLSKKCSGRPGQDNAGTPLNHAAGPQLPLMRRGGGN